MANEPVLAPHQMGPPVDFTAAGADNSKVQANQIQARNSPAFPFVRELFANAISKRTGTIMLNYTQQAVGIRFDVDGMWHDIGQRDRQSGDVMLAVMKKLADLNANERRAKQAGSFKAEFMDQKFTCHFSSQGVKTGERVLIKLEGKGVKIDTLEELGMRAKMIEQVKSVLNHENGGMLIVASMPGDGLTTTFCAALRAADRYMRDFVGLEDRNNRIPPVENVDMQTFDLAAGQTPDALLPSILLKQPEAFVVPDFVNGKTIDMLSEQVTKTGCTVAASINAKEAAEALLRVMMLKPDVEAFAKAVSAVLYTRPARRLCENCRQPYQPAPQLLHKLGLPQGRVNVMYRQWQPPPPEQLVDEKGNPIAPPICPSCGGLGYKGRFGIYELLMVNEQMRQAMIKQPKLEVLRQVAVAAKHRTVKDEGIAAAARGLSSLNEIQRVLQK